MDHGPAVVVEVGVCEISEFWGLVNLTTMDSVEEAGGDPDLQMKHVRSSISMPFFFGLWGVRHIGDLLMCICLYFFYCLDVDRV
jgi:hypothetical protein